MSARHTAKNSNSNNPFDDEKFDNSNHSGKITESIQEKNSVEPDTSPTESIHQNPLQFDDSSYSAIFTEQAQNTSWYMQQQLFEDFSLEKFQAENENLKLQHRNRIIAANKLLRKEELEPTQFLQQ